ncbi:globin family protein [Ferrovibrio sp. MS7]|uniref:globin family protein n=1 Tax=Ferrovibrio plantarum TaxID=3119164 RepID=UPI003134CF86
MTPEQVTLVQQSFAQVLPIREQAARIFYDRLFALDPALRPLFKGDMRSQGAKLMSALTFVVGSLHKVETILDEVAMLARRHVGYGVEERHYAVVGSALLGTLEEAFGPDFTPAMSAAWGAAYRLLADAMIAAARKVTPAPEQAA